MPAYQSYYGNLVHYQKKKSARYRETIVLLMSATSTCLDIAFSENLSADLKTIQVKCTGMQWNVFLDIGRECRWTYGIEYSPVDNRGCYFVGFSDSDFANDVDTIKSTSTMYSRLAMLLLLGQTRSSQLFPHLQLRLNILQL